MTIETDDQIIVDDTTISPHNEYRELAYVTYNRNNRFFDNKKPLMPVELKPLEKEITDEYLRERFIGKGRGKWYDKYISGEEYFMSLSEILVNRTASAHNKNAVLTIFGSPGDGKSATALNIADKCKKLLYMRLGKRLGVDEDYFFNPEDCLAVIDPAMLKEVMKNAQPYKIYILDDAGPGWDSRSSMSDSNKNLNYILQTMRPLNNIIIITSIHPMMIDVTIRRIMRYIAIVAETMHGKGLTFLKVFRVMTDPRSNHIYYPYLTKGIYQIRRFYSTLPDKKLLDNYNKVRDEKMQQIQSGEMNRKKAKEISPRELSIQDDIDNHGQKILEYIEKEKLSAYQISKKLPVSESRIRTILKRMNMPDQL